MMTASTGSAQPTHVTTVEGISEYRFPNGLKVLLFPDPSKPQVTVNMTVFVGSRHEGYGEAGMAHLLEHMLFKGTPTNPNVPKALQDRGAEFNGTTWLDRTNYYETLPATKENLDFALGLEADRLVNSYVKGEDLISEMTVVRNEFEQGENSPSGVLDQRIMAVAYEWHNYGQSTIGNRADIERVPISNLQAFYRKYYQPDNVMVIVSGAFDPDQVLARIDATFGKIPRPDRKLDNTYTEEPAQDGERLVTLNRVGDVGLAGAAYHIPSGAHPDYVSVDVLEHILTSPPSGRLYKALVDTRLASSVSGAAYSLHDPGVIKIIADASPGVDPRDVLSKMLEITEGIGEQGVTTEEVERAKLYWLKTWEKPLEDSARLAIQMSEWASQGDWRLMFLYRDRLEKVTVESVNDVARRYLRRNNRTAGLFIPTKAPERSAVPPTPELAAMIGNYQGRAALAEGEQFDVSAENIESRTVRGELSTGIKLALLPKKTRGAGVLVRLNLRYGNAENLKGFKSATEVLPALMLRGTKNLSRQQIQDELDRNKARLSPNGTAGEATFVLDTRREYLPASLELLRQVLREATLPDEELAIIRNSRVAAATQNLTDPNALARVVYSRTITEDVSPDDVRYVPSAEEDVRRWEGLKRGEVEKLYSGYLNGVHGEIVVIGDFDPAEIRPLLEKLVAGWTSQQPYAHIPRRGDVDVKATRTAIRTPDKENALYVAVTVFPMSDTHPDYPGLVMGNFVLGSSGLSSRLGDRVRQTEGLSYGVGSSLGASSKDERTTFLTYAITNPVNIGKVESAVREEIARLLEGGVTPAELQAAQTGYLEKQIVDRTDDRELAAILGATLNLNRTMAFYSQRDKAIRDLKVTDVNASVRKWLKPEHLAVIVAGDFKE